MTSFFDVLEHDLRAAGSARDAALTKRSTSRRSIALVAVLGGLAVATGASATGLLPLDILGVNQSTVLAGPAPPVLNCTALTPRSFDCTAGATGHGRPYRFYTRVAAGDTGVSGGVLSTGVPRQSVFGPNGNELPAPTNVPVALLCRSAAADRFDCIVWGSGSHSVDAGTPVYLLDPSQYQQPPTAATP